MSSAQPTVQELLAVLIARDLREDDGVVMVGANMPVARAAAALASMTRLPDLRVLTGLAIDNLAETESTGRVSPFTLDPEGIDTGEAWMRQGEMFDQTTFPEIFFFGGFQVDRRGNVNLLGIPDANGRWAMRGPGALSHATFSTHCKASYVVMLHHDRRTFVDRVACISAIGDRERRRELKLPGGGPRLILSPLGVFDLNESGDMRAVSLHPGVGADDVRAATAFDLEIDDEVAETEAPSDEELVVLRERVDPTGTLRV